MSWGRLALAAVAAGAVGAFLAELLRPRRRPGSSFLSAATADGDGVGRPGTEARPSRGASTVSSRPG